MSVEAHVVLSGPHQQETALKEETMSLPSLQMSFPSLLTSSSFCGPSLGSYYCSVVFRQGTWQRSLAPG